MLRVRPGVLLVRASFLPTSELITLDFPTFDRPRKAISGRVGEGKCVKSLADNMNRARIRMQTVSSVWVAYGKRRRKINSESVLCENSPPDRLVELKDRLVEQGTAEPSPGGATELSPALQRWEAVEKMIQVPEGRPNSRANATAPADV